MILAGFLVVFGIIGFNVWARYKADHIRAVRSQVGLKRNEKRHQRCFFGGRWQKPASAISKLVIQLPTIYDKNNKKVDHTRQLWKYFYEYGTKGLRMYKKEVANQLADAIKDKVKLDITTRRVSA